MKEKYQKPQIKEIAPADKRAIFEKLLTKFSEQVLAEPDLKFVAEFFKEFPAANIYLVGGMVRDAAMGVKKMAKDFDFVANKVEMDNLIKFLEKRGKVDLVGRNFGVLKFVPTNSELTEAIDIALPRTESGAGTGGYHDFSVQSDPDLPIEEDLSRRDFTINAMALNLKNGQVADPYGGLDDLAQQQIKAVLDPEQRFKEDYSRMLRALRFAAKFGFKIESQTWQAITELAPQINKTRVKNHKKERIVPTETIAKEFIKTLEQNPLRCIELYEQSGFLAELLPELLELKGCEQPAEFHSEGDAWEHTMLNLKNASSAEFFQEFGHKAPAEVLVAGLLHDIAKPRTAKHDAKKNRTMFINHEGQGAKMAQTICERLTLPSYNGKIKTENVVWLIDNHMISKAETPAGIKATKLEKIFFKDKKLGEELLMVCYCDDQASISPAGPLLDGYNILKDRLTKLRQTGDKKELPQVLMNGHQIMKEFNIPAGQQVGHLLRLIREAQLNGEIKNKEEAIELLKQELLNN